MNLRTSVTFAIIFLTSAPVLAQDLEDFQAHLPPLATPPGGVKEWSNATLAYGVAHQSVEIFPSYVFSTFNNAAFDSVGDAYLSTSASGINTGVQLPSGASIEAIEMEACDETDASDIRSGLVECGPSATEGCALVGGVDGVIITGLTEQPGCDRFGVTYAEPYVVDNRNYSLFVNVTDNDGLDETRFRAVRIFWRRQVSPAPIVATFDDVPTDHPLFQLIEAVAASGIAPECEPGKYCPGSVVTRGELAAFLARALGLHWPE